METVEKFDVQQNSLPPPPTAPENRAIYGHLQKKKSDPDRPHMATKYGAEKMSLVCKKTERRIHTLRICNAHYC